MKQEFEDDNAWIEGIHVMTEDEARAWRDSLSPETRALVDALNASENTYWNYRVVREITPNNVLLYGIREVYYANDKPVMISDEPHAPMGETFEELLDDMALQQAALYKPVLDAETRTEVEPAHLTE